MVNLVFPVLDSMDLFRTAVGSKTDHIAHAALTAAFQLVESRYQVFEQHCMDNDLELLTQDATCTALRRELLSLYAFGKPVVQNILATVQAAQNQAVRHTCQYCTIGSIKSLDHIVNKSSFPEYSVHPQNLIPCCLECNNNKGEEWVDAGNRLFLNLYTDALPRDQYLFTRITGNVAELDFVFELQKPAVVDTGLWNRIESHYQRLRLRDRLKHKAISELTDFLFTAKVALERGTLVADIKDEMLRLTAVQRRVFGVNHWKASMGEALANSALFWQHARNFRL